MGEPPAAPLPRRRTSLAGAGLVVLAGLVLVLALAGRGSAGNAPETETAGTNGPARHIGPQGRVGQFVVKCVYSHSGAMDPIVHPGQPGRSHQHDFFGAVGVDAHTTAADLLDRPTTCDKTPDTASYWHPALYDSGLLVQPVHLHAYYRAAPQVDPEDVEPFPFGLELITGDPTATRAASGEAAGWVCGVSTRLRSEPPTCPASAPLHMVLTFPDCWDGSDLRSDDHRSHVAYSRAGRCPDSHPVHVPQLTVSVKYPITGTGHDLSLASGSVFSAHGDFLNAWDPAGLEREVRQCIRRDVVCDLASNREEDGPFFG